MKLTCWFLCALFLPTLILQAAEANFVCQYNQAYWEEWTQQLEAQAQRNDFVWNTTEIDISPSGDQLAIATDDSLIIYDATTLEIIATLEASAQEEYTYFDVGWSPDGERLAVARYIYTTSRTADTRSGVQIWDVEQERQVTLLPIEAKLLDWSSDGDILATVELNSVINIWDVERGLSFDLYQDLNSFVDTMEWRPRHLELAEMGFNSRLIIHEIGESVPNFYNLPREVTGEYITWSPDGEILAIANQYPNIWLWNAENEEIERVLEGSDENEYDLQWSPDGRWLARGSSRGLYVWDMTSENTQPALVFDEHMPPFVRLAWLPNNQHLISVDYNGSIYKWDVETGCVLASHLVDWSL